MSDPTKKEIGLARVAFTNRLQAFVDYQSPEPDVLSRERDAIQLFSLALVRILFLLGENKQAPMLLEYVQTAMGDTVTPKGLQRPKILGPGQGLMETIPEKPERLMVLRLVQEEENRLAEITLPLGDEGHFYPATIIFYFQYLIRNLSDASLFFLDTGLGGDDGILREDRENQRSQSPHVDGPTYAFSTAIRYIEEERRRNQPPSAPSAN